MPLKPAARETDDHICPMVTGSTPHKGGQILPPCEPTVKVNNLAHARATDKAKCNGPTDIIVTGSALVFVGGKNATRRGEWTMHGGAILPPCSPDTYIGGPSAGVVLGNPKAAEKACKDLAKGRTSGKTKQSYGNCGIESNRQIINSSTKHNIDENNLLNMSWAKKWASKVTDKKTGKINWLESGGTSTSARQAMMTHYGVSSTTVPQSFQNVSQAVAENKAVITRHDAGKLWGTTQQGSHAINTTGVKYDSNGVAESVFINDTGTGKCGQEVPAKQYIRSMKKGAAANVTTNAIW